MNTSETGSQSGPKPRTPSHYEPTSSGQQYCLRLWIGEPLYRKLVRAHQEVRNKKGRRAELREILEQAMDTLLASRRPGNVLATRIIQVEAERAADSIERSDREIADSASMTPKLPPRDESPTLVVEPDEAVLSRLAVHDDEPETVRAPTTHRWDPAARA